MNLISLSAPILIAIKAGPKGPSVMHTHGIDTNIYHIWRGMRSRCENPTNPKYKIYGARGISVCERWHDFMNFREDMGERPTLEHSIDRIDNDGNYEPGNCRWATRSQQMRNRRSSPFVEHNGAVMHLMDAASAAGVTYQKAIHKLYRGVSFDTPSMKIKRLSEKEAGEIKWLLTNTDYSDLTVANAYGCCSGMVRNIGIGKQWAKAPPCQPSLPLPVFVAPRSAPYVLAIEEWRTPQEVRAALPEYSQGLLARLVKAGLAIHHKGNNTYKATPEALAAARVKTCPEVLP